MSLLDGHDQCRVDFLERYMKPSSIRRCTLTSMQIRPRNDNQICYKTVFRVGCRAEVCMWFWMLAVFWKAITNQKLRFNDWSLRLNSSTSMQRRPRNGNQNCHKTGFRGSFRPVVCMCFWCWHFVLCISILNLIHLRLLTCQPYSSAAGIDCSH